jgi:hypothetical protein
LAEKPKENEKKYRIMKKNAVNWLMMLSGPLGTVE